MISASAPYTVTRTVQGVSTSNEVHAEVIAKATPATVFTTDLVLQHLCDLLVLGHASQRGETSQLDVGVVGVSARSIQNRIHGSSNELRIPISWTRC